MRELSLNEITEIEGGVKTSTILLGCASIAASFAGGVGTGIGIALTVYAIVADN